MCHTLWISPKNQDKKYGDDKNGYKWNSMIKFCTKIYMVWINPPTTARRTKDFFKVQEQMQRES